MCGIVGYVGERPAVDILVNGLKRLEYRGYDSTGVAFLEPSGKIEIKKSEGKLENVEKILKSLDPSAIQSHCGIGHTRWATHGKPTTQNAHPHRAEHVVLIHNGIIENYQKIKADILARGHKVVSETDSELFGFLVLDEMKSGKSLFDAVRVSFSKLQGGNSIVVMSEKEPGVIVGVRNGSPLVATIDPQGGAMLASDAQPLLAFSKNVTFLEHGDVAVATRKGINYFDLETGKPVVRKEVTLDWSLDKLDKQGFAHYMLKEIHEQPTALVDTINGLLDRVVSAPFALASQPGLKILDQAEDIYLIACGTSYYAALEGKYWLETWARTQVHVEYASEFRYSKPVFRKGSVVIGISQSGETADTMAVLREVKKQGIKTLAITNVRGSSMCREVDDVFFTSAGPEIGVAATKSFSAQLMTILLLAGYIAKTKNPGAAEPLFADLIRLPHLMAADLEEGSPVRLTTDQAAKALQSSRGFFFMGRGYSYPIALEGALKLKEIAYVHAEGYAAGELKHGPIAMIDANMAVVVLAPRDHWRDKTVSNLEEVKARGAKILGIGSADDAELRRLCDYWIPLSQHVHESLMPFFLTTAVQLLSYNIAVLKGTDVDKPRNLAKSVTVE
jgi:glucosamine--fructose-6-phosphate aminotransferase (isomerizing)